MAAVTILSNRTLRATFLALKIFRISKKRVMILAVFSAIPRGSGILSSRSLKLEEGFSLSDLIIIREQKKRLFSHTCRAKKIKIKYKGAFFSIVRQVA